MQKKTTPKEHSVTTPNVLSKLIQARQRVKRESQSHLGRHKTFSESTDDIQMMMERYGNGKVTFMSKPEKPEANDSGFLSVSDIRKFECKNIVDACYYLEHIERYEK